MSINGKWGEDNTFSLPARHIRQLGQRPCFWIVNAQWYCKYANNDKTKTILQALVYATVWDINLSSDWGSGDTSIQAVFANWEVKVMLYV